MLRFFEIFYIRWMRRRRRLRAVRKGRELRAVRDRTSRITNRDILLVTTLHNEAHRLEFFLSYYRKLGVTHFLIIDNASTDNTAQLIENQHDVSVWRTGHSYRRANYGMDWVNDLLRRYGCGHWCLVVDADEFLVYPHENTRPLQALTDWLDASSLRALGCMLLDMYPETGVPSESYRSGANPFGYLTHFDSGNYFAQQNQRFGNLWIQGGPRMRRYFAETPENAPALNKIPLVKWRRGQVYVSSTHMLLPRRLNRVYEAKGGANISGLLLHAKFLPDLAEKASREVERNQHFADGREYAAYQGVQEYSDLCTENSVRYRGWKQLAELGLLSQGGWV